VQVVAGTNYEIRINVTCPSANNSDNDNTLGLEAHVFWPLPGSNEEPEVHAALACTVCCMPHWPMLHAVLSASTPAVRRRGNLLTHQPLDLPPLLPLLPLLSRPTLWCCLSPLLRTPKTFPPLMMPLMLLLMT
jgi:hypothetical protein